jgi:hypothetical protein
MTQEQGKVTVVVPVPVLGEVTGTRTLKSLVSGQADPPKDEAPPVVTRPLSGKPPAGGNGAVRS